MRISSDPRNSLPFRSNAQAQTRRQEAADERPSPSQTPQSLSQRSQCRFTEVCANMTHFTMLFHAGDISAVSVAFPRTLKSR